MWYIITLLSGFSFATADAFSKREAKNISTIVLAWVREVYALPFLLPILFIIEIPELDKIFWIAMAICVAMDFVTTILYMKAITIAPLSLTIPYLGLTPIFALIISMIILGESATIMGFFGILLISAGAYILQIDRAKYGLFEPILSIFKNRGSLYMLMVSLAYAVTANVGKLAIQHSSPLFMCIIYFSLLGLAFSPFVLIKSRNDLTSLTKPLSGKIKIGLAMAVMAITHFTAISMMNVAYMISIKRLSMLFAIIYGWLFFKEKNIKERMTGAIIIIIGAACIAFA